jgi:hypothetical protein
LAVLRTQGFAWRLTTDCCGGVAQLGEHLLCKQGVTGSIPVVSTMAWCVRP